MSVNEVRHPKARIDFQVKGEGGASTFCIGDEDHTLANSLRHVLLNDGDHVDFAGYSVPHPSEPVVQIRVQTVKGKNGAARKPAIAVLQEACTTLNNQCQHVIEELEAMIPEVKTDRLQNEARLREEAQREEEEDDMDEDDDE
jgi:DNA-directed RNA polymerase I and III subunit RPAC2